MIADNTMISIGAMIMIAENKKIRAPDNAVMIINLRPYHDIYCRHDNRILVVKDHTIIMISLIY